MKSPTKERKIDFLDRHEPPLKDGNYTLNITHKVEGGKKTVFNDSFTTRRSFTIAGERFKLNPKHIHAVFPPADSDGDHETCLPHIVLTRNTLPWERSALPAKGSTKKTPKRGDVPWLALLLFDEDEIANSSQIDELKRKSQARHSRSKTDVGKVHSKVMAVGELPNAKHLSGLDVDLNYRIQVVVGDRQLLRALLPKNASDLMLLAHSRQWENEQGHALGNDRAVIMGTRLPRAGATSVAHLVSVENLYDAVDGKLNIKKSADPLVLVSLKSWRFHCRGKSGFKHLVKSLDLGHLRIPAPPGFEAAETFLSHSFCPLPHHRNGQEPELSWYHGPLIGDPNPSNTALPLPVRHARALFVHDPKFGMCDASYAAAWQLGRLLALRSKRFSSELFVWKRSHQRFLAGVESQIEHLPFKRQEEADLPPFVAQWFRDLSLLHGVPFNHLVPNEGMLPKESLRLFALDRNWIACLCDGAFSVGRIHASDHQHDQRHYRQHQSGTSHPFVSIDYEKVTGVLIRSEVVSGWPDLEVEGHAVLRFSGKLGVSKRAEIARRLDKGKKSLAELRIALAEHGIAVSDTDHHIEIAETGSDNKTGIAWRIVETRSSKVTANLRLDGGADTAKLLIKLPSLRQERMSANVLLCLFAGKIDCVDIHQRPEGVHFGLSREDDGTLTKSVRDLKSGQLAPDQSLTLGPKDVDDRRVMNVDAMRRKFAKQWGKKPQKIGSGAFALLMVEGVVRVRIGING